MILNSNRAYSIVLLTASILLLGNLVEAKAAVVFTNNDWSGTTGSVVSRSDYSQVGGGAYYLPVVIPGWGQSGQVGGWSLGDPYVNPITGILLNEGYPGLAQGGITDTVGGLTTGDQYTLSFNYWGDNRPTDVWGPGSTYNLIYSIGANLNSVNGSWTTAQSGSYNTINYAFTATGPTETLAFQSNTPGDSSSSPIIGSVTITSFGSATPEPSSIVLWGVLIAGGLLVARRRKS